MKQNQRITPVAVDRTGENLSAAHVMARALAEASPDDARLHLARAFCYRLVAAWWSALSGNDARLPLRDFLLPFDLPHLPEPAVASADSIGQAAATLEPEAAAYSIGLTYTGMLPNGYRSTYGIYYTPPVLTARLIDQATTAGVDWKTARVLDPACGGGAFLAPIARRMLEAMPDVEPALLIKNVANRLHGVEIDPFAAWLSQVTLDAVMLQVCKAAGRKLPVVVTVGDSLKRQPSTRDLFDLVIGNPPYGRVTLSNKDRQRFKRCLYGHANLYGLFTDLALSHVKHGGVVAYVTPTSFLAGEYFKNLRATLGKETCPLTADFVALRKGVFEDVLQETLLATYRRGSAYAPARCFELLTSKNGEIHITPAGSFALPEDPSRPWLLPRTPEQAVLVGQLKSMPHRLADWGYSVSTGPLVWNRFKPQMRDCHVHGSLPLIWAEAVTSDGRFVHRAEKRNHMPYFFPNGAADDWLITKEPCVLLQRTTAKEQHRRLIAAALPASFIKAHGGVVIENHLNMVRPTRKKPAISSETLAAFLNSAAADRAFRCVSGSVAVSAYEIENIPLPDPERLTFLEQLVKQQADRNLIENECRHLFDNSNPT